jgi:hypothetical protein
MVDWREGGSAAGSATLAAGAVGSATLAAGAVGSATLAAGAAPSASPAAPPPLPPLPGLPVALTEDLRVFRSLFVLPHAAHAVRAAATSLAAGANA